jgi:SAM-dependent methyltransferase
MTKTAEIYNQHAAYWLKKATLRGAFPEAVFANIKNTDVVLDVGCGGGRLCKALYPHVSQTVGVDFAANLLEAAKNESPESTFICGDVEEPATLNTAPIFDVVISKDAIRKSHCRLDRILYNLRQHQKGRPFKFIARIQASNDLPQIIDNSALYTMLEIQTCFPVGAELRIEKENFLQGFSSIEYFKLFLERIGLKSLKLPTGKNFKLQRSYYIVIATIK